MSEVKAGAVINYVAFVIRIATSLLLTPFVISNLGVEEYGLFMLSHSILVWLALTDLGLGATVSKYVVTYRAKGELKEQAHFLGQSLMLYTLLGFIGLAGGLVGYWNLDALFPSLQENQRETFSILYLLTLGNFVLCFPLRPLNAVPGAYQRFIVPGIISLSTSLLNAGLTVLLLWLGFKSIALTMMSVCVAITMLLWGVGYAVIKLSARVKFSKPDISLYKGMFGFAMWVFLSQIMDMFYWQAGSPILASVSGTVAVSVFSLGILFSQCFITASTAISGVLAPKLMHMVALNACKEELTHVMSRAGRLQLFLLVLIILGFACFGRDFLVLWVGKTMGENITTIWMGALCVMVPLLIPLSQNTGLAILQALSIHKGRAIILFYSSLICVVLGYILSYILGPIGMFIGTAISLTIGQGVMINVYYQKKAGLHMGLFFRHTYLPMLFPVVILATLGIGISYAVTISDWMDFTITAACYGTVSAATLFILYLNKDERLMFITPVKKILRIK